MKSPQENLEEVLQLWTAAMIIWLAMMAFNNLRSLLVF